MTLSFGLTAPKLLEELKDGVERLKGNDLDRSLARECACKAWHLCDHAFKALGSNSQFSDLKELQRYVRCACPELAYLQAICNESKHGERSKHDKVTDQIKAACYRGGAFSRAFDTPSLEIELADDRKVFVPEVFYPAVEFWSTFFKDHGIK